MLNIELPHNLAILLLDIHPKELKTSDQTKICIQMFVIILFTIVRRWKQPKCSSVDEWINKIWYIYIIEYYSAIKMKY